ncbi:MAG TPA: ROK family protein [Pyrinomonadaceae bacterium]|nr:ROK family protein [Chloracidobacterium sp.]MBK7802358.1 ROK family protein [Chloracidobacterium sp.]MBK9437228.1 ROK family protein [Chloracidobacterium sp.]MBP9937098.1 ROK family protein [Pyrinomonadaceae bacterium]HQY67799.1 ROK family protein [Pyrinomonadaceae bacterium]
MSEVGGKTTRYVGVEVSSKSLTAVCIDENGVLSATDSVAVDFRETSSKQVAAFIQSLKGKFGPFDIVGVAVPGLVSRDAKSIAFSAHIPEHSGLDLAAEIEAATGVAAYVENDANAAAYGEFILGAGRGSRNAFYATLGTGVGGALIIEGEIWRGVAGFAGEFGYVPINSEGLRLEEVASSANIIRRTRDRFHQDNTSSLVEIDENLMTIADIVGAAIAEDDFAKLMLERTGNYVGTAVASVINLLNIERIIVGGEIMQAGNIVLDAIVARASELSFGPSFDSTVIAAGELGDNASAAGAALLAAKAS